MQEQVLEALDTLQAPVSRREIAEALGVSQTVVDSAIAELNAKGKIVIRTR